MTPPPSNPAQSTQGDLVETLLNQSFKGQDGMRSKAAKEIVSLRARVAELEAELRTLVGWRLVNLQGEYEHGLRDVIRSMIDCADAALQPKEPK